MMGMQMFGVLSTLTLFLVVSRFEMSSGLAVMSVDLGSEWLKVAIVKPGVPMEIVLNKESRRKTPLSIALKDDEMLFGDPAMGVGVRFPKSNYYYFQDLLAKSIDNPLVQLFETRFPFYNMDQDEDRGTVYFNHDDDLQFQPEELLAIALNKSREAAETFAEQIIKDVVITVPSYFNQAERRSVLYAAELAGLRVLQLMNDNAAVALNYGVFRRNDFNATPTNIMFYDMGACSTTASIVSYQMVKTKERGILETNPQLSVKGVGFDRTLGGLEWEVRLQKHLAHLFDQQSQTTNKAESSDRAMAKILKEAKRVKKVLSANNDITSQIEGLLDDQDFKAHVSRTELEEMTADLFERVGGPVERALKASEMTMDEIDQVILVGGGTRIPKVQETLLKVTGKKELGKSINADEAAALGAVYHAAHLSKGFKVKKFIIKDANVFPIQVEFERELTDDDGREVTRLVRRTLFGVSNPFPQKKVMTFNKHYDDFKIQVNYGDLERVMRPEDLEAFGTTNLAEVELKGVKKAIEKNKDRESKGIKAHFRLDESGMFHLDTVESVFESVENVTETEEEEQSTLAKLGSTISRFFSGGSPDEDDGDGKMETEEDQPAQGEEEAEQAEKPEGEAEGVKPEDTTAEKQDSESEKTAGEEASPGQEQEEAVADGKEGEDAGKEQEKSESTGDEEKKTEEGEKKEESKEGEKTEESKDTKEEDKEEEKKEVKPKIVQKKENITAEMKVLDLADPSKESRKASRIKLRELKKKEEERQERERSLNALEAYIFDMQDKLYDETYEKCSTEEEREEIRSRLSEASDWLYDQDADVEARAYKDKLKALKKLTKDLGFRVEQYKRRSEIVENSKGALNASYHFMLAAKNMTGEDLLYTEAEFNLLEKAYNDTNTWFTTKLEEQERTPLTEKPVLLVSDAEEKLLTLEREVRYLVGKAKRTPRPKKKKEDKPKKKKKKPTTKTNATETEDGEKEEAANGGAGEGDREDEEKVVIPPPEETGETKEGDTETKEGDAETKEGDAETKEGDAETLELEGGDAQQTQEPTEATEGEGEQTLEEPLQLEAPAEEETEDGTPEEETTEKPHKHAEDYHKNGDL